MINPLALNHESLTSPPIVASRPLHSSFAWALTGNIIYALSQWGMVIALARLGTPSALGRFTLGIAISTPILMLANLQLRSVLASDAGQGYDFHEYFGLRLVTTSLALAMICTIAFTLYSDFGIAVVIAAVGLAKSVESISDLFYGLFQLNDRLDQIGKSMIIKGVISALGFSLGLYFGGHILWAIGGLAIGWMLLLVLFDIRRGLKLVAPSRKRSMGRRVDLARRTIPLGLVTTFIALNLHMPRYFIQAVMGEEQQGAFSAVAYTTVAVILIADALGHAAIPRLARFYMPGTMDQFRGLVMRLSIFAVALAVASVLAAALAGSFLLAVVFGPDYVVHAQLFTWLLASGGLSGLAFILTVGLTAARFFRVQVVMFAFVTVVNAAACAVLIPRFGLTGAAAALVIAESIHVALAALLIGYVCFSKPPVGNQFTPSREIANHSVAL
jgi:O-antigen/teichoic acid export membrane protein